MNKMNKLGDFIFKYSVFVIKEMPEIEEQYIYIIYDGKVQVRFWMLNGSLVDEYLFSRRA